MVLFANGVEGSATATAGCCLLFVWALVLGPAGIGFLWSSRFSELDSPGRKKTRIAVLVLSGLVPLTCCLAPPLCVRVTRGNFPTSASQIRPGMTKEQVLEQLGPPHSRVDDDDLQPRWYYWNDSYGLFYDSVWFGPDGRVSNVGGN
ncbi:outer membrane protein assembly factor BamE [Gemmata sp.]|uniref:outer membrane protein assembly factor BamE n=1 Tax=Gemmata sp. TaxID=1914242 RepID=UPI003F704A5E